MSNITVEGSFQDALFSFINERIKTQSDYVAMGVSNAMHDDPMSQLLDYRERVARIAESKEIREEIKTLLNIYFGT